MLIDQYKLCLPANTNYKGHMMRYSGGEDAPTGLKLSSSYLWQIIWLIIFMKKLTLRYFENHVIVKHQPLAFSCELMVAAFCELCCPKLKDGAVFPELDEERKHPLLDWPNLKPSKAGAVTENNPTFLKDFDDETHISFKSPFSAGSIMWIL